MSGLHPWFVLGAPRTGSTLLYKALIQGLELGYISNYVAERHNADPCAGLDIQAKMLRPEISPYSRFGHTVGIWQPSEANAILRGNPMAAVTLAQCGRKALRREMVFKCAWLCHHIEKLAEALPGAIFIHVTRNIREAALSDLHARYVTRRDPCAWTGPWPRSLPNGGALPYQEAVVENQIALETEIRQGLSQIDPNSIGSVSYEHLTDGQWDLWPVRTDLADRRAITEAVCELSVTPRGPGWRVELPEEDVRRVTEYAEQRIKKW